ncbi:MAG TPA: rod shape-determining protein MreC [Chloroflexota bacterium]|nr:rod shape-determining protein MreC [Chloroflexota bacterium]
MLTRLVYLVVILVAGALILALSRLPQVQFIETIAFEVLGPVEVGVSIPAGRLDQIGQTIEGIGQLRAENARLRAEVDRLSQEAVLLPELQRENAELRAELQFQQTDPQFKWITARVIGVDPSNLVHSIIVDHGSRSGIVVGMTVTTPGGLVGQVVQVTPNTAKVLLVTDVSSSVASLIQSNRAKGVVNGSRGGQLTMTYIPQGVKVQAGDRVVTSGLGGVYPKGLWVGTITEVHQNDVELYQEAKVQPAVDFGRIEDVLVIVNHLPTSLH